MIPLSSSTCESTGLREKSACIKEPSAQMIKTRS